MSTIGGFSAGGPDRFLKPDATLVADVQKDLDQLKGLIAAGQAHDGTVDLAQLEQRIDATGDAELREAFATIIESLPKPPAPTTFTSGCGGGTSTTSSYSSGCGGTSSTSGAASGGAAASTTPKAISRDEVQRVLADLAAARSKAAQLDQDGDGRLSFAETRQGRTGHTREGSLISAMQEGYRTEIAKWAAALDAVGSSVDSRKSVDKHLSEVAHAHAKTPAGAEAIIAAYRDVITSGGTMPDLDKVLRDAESGFGKLIRCLPLFGGKRDHLSDKEVEKLLGTDDLAAFTKDKNAAIEARLGGDYLNHYLAGKDLEGHQHLGDDDYQRFSSRCS